MKSISIISCFTDDELEPLAKQLTTENRMKITLQHNMAQRMLSFDFSTGPLTMDIIDALCHRTCVHQLYVSAVEIAGEECFPDLHGVDSKIDKLEIAALAFHDDQSSSYCLGKFLGLLPHLTDLEIESCSLHDDFYKEIAARVSASLIQRFMLQNLYLHNDQSESHRPLGKFLSLLPRLTDLEIVSCSFHDDFYKEIADRASSSQIQKFMVRNLDLHDNQSASFCLGNFVGFLSHLTDLEIRSCSLHDDFYKEIALLASSSQVQTVDLDYQGYRMPDKDLSHLASKQLAKFLCSLPCLTILEIKDNKYLLDDFFTELASLAASSQNPYFRQKQHISMLQEWSVKKQQQQQRC
eukprot:XP_011678585.1 PREDICTED: uncharacterized protein LOC105445137 [Strongylocentrotus purpuratus]